MWEQEGDETLPADMSGASELRDGLLQIHVTWDPYLGEAEGWAPDFSFQKAEVSAHGC